jgi:hypothetical protein
LQRSGAVARAAEGVDECVERGFVRWHAAIECTVPATEGSLISFREVGTAETNNAVAESREMEMMRAPRASHWGRAHGGLTSHLLRAARYTSRARCGCATRANAVMTAPTR